MAYPLVWALALVAAISCPTINAQGQQVAIGDVPSIAQVEVRVGSLWFQQCAASVLTSWHVLSSASCFSGALYVSENRRIRAGSSIRGDGGVIREVSFANNHPSYGVIGSDGDISVVRLEFAVPLGDNVQQVRILAQGASIPAGLPATICGWGRTAQGESPSDSNLYMRSVVTLPPCGDSFSGQAVTSNMLCAGLSSGGIDYDARDLGAPLVYDNVAIGLVAFGAEDSPVVATAISSYTNWIVASAV